jgi:signal transduction histidine kinase
MTKRKSNSRQPKRPAKKPAHRGAQEFELAVERAKLGALKELAYGASHEINNPLANIATRAQTLLKQESDPEKRRMLASIYAQAMRAHEMIADLMLFARPPAIELSRFELRGFLRGVVDEMLPQAAEQKTELVFVPMPAVGGGTHAPTGAACEIEADATQLAVAIRALIQNSSGREAGRGLGFGLSKCWRIVTDHGGEINVEKLLPTGAVFRLILPLVASGQNAS